MRNFTLNSSDPGARRYGGNYRTDVEEMCYGIMLSSRESIDWNSVHLDWNGSLDLGKNRLGFRLDVERSTVAWKIVVEPC